MSCRACLLPWVLFVGCETPPLSLDAAEPGVVCATTPGTLRLLGSGLEPTVVGGLGDAPQVYLPAVLLSQGDLQIAFDGADERLRWVSPAELSLVLETALSPGTWDISVLRADGARASLTGALDALARPALETPDAVCHDTTTATLWLSGAGLAFVDGAPPQITIHGAPVTVLAGDGCVPTAGPRDVELCTAVEISFDPSVLPLGWVSLAVDHPDPAACGPIEGAIEIIPAPQVSAVEPEALCLEGGSLTVRGEDLRPDTTVLLGGVPATLVEYVDARTLVVSPGAGTPTGTLDVSVVAAGGCEDTLPSALDVVGGPLAFYVEPPSLPVGRAAEVRVLVANVIDEVESVWLEDGAGVVSAVDWRWSPDEPGAVYVSVPEGLATGSYGVGVSLAGSCASTSSGVLRLVADTPVPISEVQPSFAWVYDTTAVEIHGAGGFIETPSAVLLDAAGTAYPLLGVGWRDADLLTARVPAGLPLGSYALLVENPDGALGFLEDALEVTSLAPPTVESIRPLTLSSSQDTEITIQGQDFRDPEVWLTCQDGAVGSATVLSWSYGTIQAEVGSAALGQTVCVVEVLNSDGASGRYASVSITNPAQNLAPWSSGSPLNVARRAPATAAGRVDAVSRYVYALGGDDGDAAGALDSLEVVEIGVYGDMGDWVLRTAALPSARTLAGLVVVGRYLYLLGGDDGAGAVDEVWRALILDPDEAPQLLSPSMFLSDRGLEPGAWRYAVSAIYDATDARNPGGESLHSEPQRLLLPETAGDLYQPVLRWSAVADAVGYRVYRSPEEGDTTLGWIADVTTLTLTDTGLTADASRAPRVPGELGAWIPVAALATPRSGACFTVAPDPEPDPEIVYIYAAGGQDALGTPLDTIERLDIRVTSPRSQTPGSWSTLPLYLSDARYGCGAYTVSSAYHTVVEDGESWVFFAGGVTSGGRSVGTVDAGRITADGALASWQEADSMSPARAGFGLASASNYLYAFGGQKYEPSSSGVSAELEAPLPDFRNWNSLGTALSEARLLPGSAQESSVIFVVGGATATAGATTSTEATNY